MWCATGALLTLWFNPSSLPDMHRFPNRHTCLQPLAQVELEFIHFARSTPPPLRQHKVHPLFQKHPILCHVSSLKPCHALCRAMPHLLLQHKPQTQRIAYSLTLQGTHPFLPRLCYKTYSLLLLSKEYQLRLQRNTHSLCRDVAQPQVQ